MATQTISWYRGFIQGKTRIVSAWVFAALLVISAREYPSWPGVVICFLGASLRFWASGYLRKDQRIAVGGPYAFIRHPLYFGTFLMAVGTAISIEAWVLLAILCVAFAAIYRYIILDEENKLRGFFGEAHDLYRELVPGFVPRILPASHTELVKVNPDPEAYLHSWTISKKNKAMEAYWSWVGLIGFVTLVAWIRQTYLY